MVVLLFAIHQSAITSYFTGRIDITWDAFETISMVTSTPSIIGANVNTPYNNISELVAAAKKLLERLLLVELLVQQVSLFFFY